MQFLFDYISTTNLPYQFPFRLKSKYVKSLRCNNILFLFYYVYFLGEQKDELNGAMMLYIFPDFFLVFLMNVAGTIYSQFSHKLCVWHREKILHIVYLYLL